MLIPADLPLTAYRNVVYQDAIAIEGIDLTGADLLMQIRIERDAAGPALIELEPVVDITTEEGLFLSVATVDGELVSTIQIHIAYNTLQTVADAVLGTALAGEDCVLKYDLITTGIGAAMQMFCRGTFTIEGSVTRLP